MANLLRVSNLNFSYHDNKIFQNLSFTIEENTINAVLGSNNCGKTTLIRILSGDLLFDGNIILDNLILNKENYKKYLNLLGVVFPRTSRKIKFDNVSSLFEFSLQKRGYSKRKIKNILCEMDDLFNIGTLFRKKILNLSKKEKIEVMIILSVIDSPKLLLLDDIYDDLNSYEAKEISLLLEKVIKEKKVTILFTTTRLDMCINCDKIIFVNEGKVEIEGDFDYISGHDNVLARNGIDISIMLDLSLKLKFYNLLDEVILEPDRMVERLWQ